MAGSTWTPSRWQLVKVAAVVAVVVAAALNVKVVDIEDAAAVGGKQFDAASYVSERYDAKILPAVQSQSADLVTVLAALEGSDAAAAREQYGHAPGPNSAASFSVKGTGVAGAPKGSLLPLTVAGAPEGAKVQLQIGPAINGTALRDSTGLVQFNEFLNQLEFQKVATELNTQVKKSALADVDRSALEGKTVTFTGAFTETRTGLVSIVPVELEVG